MGSTNPAKLEPVRRVFAGLEAGVEFDAHGSWLFNVAVILRADGRRGMARGGSVLPPAVGERLQKGEELGLIMDDLVGQKDTKKGGGAVGFLTLSRIERLEFWQLALPPFLRPELYPR